MLLKVGLSLEPKFEIFFVVENLGIHKCNFSLLDNTIAICVTDFTTDVPSDLISVPNIVPLTLMFPLVVIELFTFKNPELKLSPSGRILI